MRVLVTRPKNFAQELSIRLSTLDIAVESCPMVSIHPTPHQARLYTAIQELSNTNMAIFVSRNAVDFTLPHILAHWGTVPPIAWVAIGQGTAKSLQQYQVPKVIFPAHPPYESEALLQLPALKNLHQKKLVIFRGNNGRNLLTETLVARGAKVKIVESYQRSLPIPAIVERLAKLHHTSIDVIVTTSAECLNNLNRLIKGDGSWLKNIPIIVVGLRMQTLAHTLGFRFPILAAGADDMSIIKALTDLKDKRP